jgi:hypothetical protein
MNVTAHNLITNRQDRFRDRRSEGEDCFEERLLEAGIPPMSIPAHIRKTKSIELVWLHIREDAQRFE